MRVASVLIQAVLGIAIGSGSAPALSAAYFGFNDFGGTWLDADKRVDNTEDDLMCWAASASNILAWTGWGDVAGLTNTDDIFGYFQDHWTDQGGNPYYGWDWWFDGTNDTQGTSGWSQVDIPGGGFWAHSYQFIDYVLFSSTDQFALDSLSYLLRHGYGVSLSLGGTGAHSMTAWGFEYDASDSGSYEGIYVTDSDDYLNALRYYEVAYNTSQDAWYLQNYYGNNGWYITEVMGLDRRPVTAPPMPLLIGMGLLSIGLTSAWRKRQDCPPASSMLSTQGETALMIERFHHEGLEE